jgi:hypothetical protein
VSKPHDDRRIPYRTVIRYNLFIFGGRPAWPGCMLRPLHNRYGVVHRLYCLLAARALRRLPAVQI